MDTTDEKNGAFPEGFEHIQGRLDETTQHLKQLDDQIKNIPKEKGPTFVYRPSGFVGRVIPGSRDKTRIALEEKQHEVKLDALTKTEAETRNAPGQSGRIVRDRVREQLFPNPYRTASSEERLTNQNKPKEIEQSQDYMDAMLKPKEITLKEVVQPQQNVPEARDKANVSLSARFSLSLGYTKMTDQVEKSITKSRVRQADMDRD